MIAAFLLALLMQLPVPAPAAGTTLTLTAWDARGDVDVVVESATAGPVDWTDGTGARHHARTITYRDPQHGRLTTTLEWFLAHARAKLVLVPTGPPVPFHDLPWPFAGPLKPPASNQDIQDGIARPADILYHVPRSHQEYSTTYQAKIGVPR